MAGEEGNVAKLPAAPVSCCGRFMTESNEGGRKVVTTVTPHELRGKPARELTIAEGRKVACFLSCRGDITLAGPITAFRCKNNAGLEFTSPGLERKWPFWEIQKETVEKDGKQVVVRKQVFSPDKDFMGPERIGISSVVKLKDLANEPEVVLNNLVDTRTDPRSQVCLNLDFRNLVGLYKLLEMLVGRFGVTQMLHAGIGAGAGPCTDCHNTGRAIDFSGVRGRTRLEAGQPEVDYDIRVLQDWGMKPIIDQAGKPAGQHEGGIFFFSATDKTFFRLESQGVPAPSTFNERMGIRIFTAVYDFAVDQYVERGFQRGAGYSQSGSPPSTPLSRTQIGNGSFILNPDADGGNGKAHTNHMHMQIGPTGLEDQYQRILGSPTT
ncbi:MAG TPA: hypothetical protein VH253_08125 [Phycisphaerae bacterium]|nr:hypothetical protein [Phycisphaerae bacterium]